MQNNNLKFLYLREKYDTFVFEKYEIVEDEEFINLKFYFNIVGLVKFSPVTKILKKNFKFKQIDNNFRNIAFNLGLVELISYWKATCSKNVIIKCGNLTNEQILWFKKLYFYGLGELFFTNGIKTDIESFMNITCEGEFLSIEEKEEPEEGYIIPIGGGKDSVVTLELLQDYKDKSYAFIVNPREVTLECAKIAGFEKDKIIEVKRILDKKIVTLNGAGFINGHTPFSSMLAFLTYFVASLMNIKYITLSNESSANESNVEGEKINHQYSKSYEFENDFYEYQNNYLKSNVLYFSLLRPLAEIQIANLFSQNDKYYRTIKSCNVGSKSNPWKWCCNCPKCLFVYIIMSAFFSREKLLEMFGEDMLNKESLKETFIELCGYGKTKPFECVGTYYEVKFAISKLIEKTPENELPILAKFYKDNYEIIRDNEILKGFNDNNNLPKYLENMLRKKIEEC